MGFVVALVVNFVLKVGDVFFVAQVLLVDGSFVGLEEISRGKTFETIN